MSDRTSGSGAARSSGGSRARTSGRTSGRASGAVSGGPHIVIRVGAERFALPATVVHELIDAPAVTWVPGGGAGVLGQLRYRFRTVTAFDAAGALGVPRGDGPGAALILRDAARRIAIIVDDVEDLVNVEPSRVLPLPPGTDPDGLLAGVYIWEGAANVLVSVVRGEPFLARVAAHARDEPGGTT